VDLRGERGLRDRQGLCRSREAALIGDLNEIPQLPEFH